MGLGGGEGVVSSEVLGNDVGITTCAYVGNVGDKGGERGRAMYWGK